MPGAVRVADPGGRGGQLGERLYLEVRVGDSAGQRLGVGGQPGRTVRVTGLGGRRGYLGKRLSLILGAGNGPGQSLGTIQVAGLGDRSGQIGEHRRLIAGAGYSAGDGLGLSGQPGRAVPIAGLGTPEHKAKEAC